MFVVVLLLVLWPLVEIAVFLQVVAWIGVLETLALMVVISLCGAWLVKRQGIGTLARMRAELDDLSALLGRLNTDLAAMRAGAPQHPAQLENA